MATHLAVDDRLLEEARKLGGHSSKREALTAALDEYVKRRRQLAILGLFGKIEYETSYDYKRERPT